jgi:rsbT antagonist protein RsbS
MEASVARVPLQVSRDCVIASIQVELSEEVLRQFRVDLLERLHASGVSGVILDVSGIQVMDLRDFEVLRRTMTMARLLGARPMLAGLRAGVVSSLVELGAETEDLEAARDLDDAFRIMEGPKAAIDADDEEEDHASVNASPSDQD